MCQKQKESIQISDDALFIHKLRCLKHKISACRIFAVTMHRSAQVRLRVRTVMEEEMTLVKAAKISRSLG